MVWVWVGGYVLKVRSEFKRVIVHLNPPYIADYL